MHTQQDRWSNLQSFNASIFLSDKYLDWFLHTGHPGAEKIDDLWLSLLGNSFIASSILRRSEAQSDPANVRTDPTQDFLDGDWYERRGKGMPGKTQALDRPNVFKRLSESVFDRLEGCSALRGSKRKKDREDGGDHVRRPTKSMKG